MTRITEDEIVSRACRAYFAHADRKGWTVAIPCKRSYFDEADQVVYLTNGGGLHLLARYRWTGSKVSRLPDLDMSRPSRLGRTWAEILSADAPSTALSDGRGV